jgi:peptidyl-prolyl cis-trans isomerase A (cyclophilin A)
MRYIIICISIFTLLTACAPKKYKYPRVKIQTERGDMVVELYPDKAPKTVAAFLSYVDAGYYNNSTFYRVWNDDNQVIDAYKARLIQGGLWRTNPKLSLKLPGVPHETTKQSGIQHTNGVISLARAAPGTATTEFFICIGNQYGFDYGGANNPDGQGYASFGKVVEGLGVMRNIYDAPEEGEYFVPPIMLYNIVRL